MLLIDCEEDRTFRAVLVGMLREANGRRLRAGRSPGPITTEEHFRTFSMDRTGREAARTA
jgi:hypothetical protein